MAGEENRIFKRFGYDGVKCDRLCFNEETGEWKCGLEDGLPPYETRRICVAVASPKKGGVTPMGEHSPLNLGRTCLMKVGEPERVRG